MCAGEVRCTCHYLFSLNYNELQFCSVEQVSFNVCVSCMLYSVVYSLRSVTSSIQCSEVLLVHCRGFD